MIKYMPKISIVIPVYNADKFLTVTLDSVQKQTFQDFECVIVNDGSTDNSLEIINRYVHFDNRFIVYTVANNGCANIPRNIAVEKAVGEYIFNLDADDLIDSDCLEKMYLRICEANTDLVLQTTISFHENINNQSWRLPLESFNYEMIASGIDICKLTIGGWEVSCAGFLAKRALFNGISIGNYTNSDEVFSRFVLLNAKQVAFSNSNYYYRNNIDSISKSMSSKIFDKVITDYELEQFVLKVFWNDEVTINKMIITRFFNLLYLYADFSKYKNNFKLEQQLLISSNFKTAFYNQKTKLLKKQLPVQFHILFLYSYSIFKISSIVYVYLKTIKGRNYILK